MKRIGTLAESSLHAALKAHYARPGDLLEGEVAGYVVDIVRPTADGGSQCIEIQTRHLGQMKPKLLALLEQHPVQVVHPIAQERYIARVAADGAALSRRKSPKHGRVLDLFPELVGLAGLMTHPNLTLEVVLIGEEQLWRDDGQGSWRRRRWSIADRRLLHVGPSCHFAAPADFAALLPADLPEPFDTAELAALLPAPRRLAQQMVYCLRTMGLVQATGKRGRLALYRRTPSPPTFSESAITPVEKVDKFQNLLARPQVILGSPDDLVEISWEDEAEPGPP